MKFHIIIQESDKHLAMVNYLSTISVSVRTSVVIEGPLQGYTGYKFLLDIKISLKFKNVSKV
jgi:hypothetical protein